jgi:glycosyltransferase involved in cell wall biosynthesis
MKFDGTSRGMTAGGAPPEPAVSIVLAVRNGAGTLRHALHSIIWQTMPDWELLVVDDGSDDATESIGYGFEDPRIRLFIDGQRLGLAARLNQGIGQARGHYIARMDADDVALPDRLARQVAFLEEHPTIDVVGGHALIVNARLELRGVRVLPSSHNRIVKRPLGPVALMHPTICGKRSWFRQHPYDARLLGSEDQELFIRAAPVSRYANLPVPVLAYREGDLRFTKQWRNRTYLTQGLVRLATRRGALRSLIRPAASIFAKAIVESAAIMLGVGDHIARRRRIDPTPDQSAAWQHHRHQLDADPDDRGERPST